MGIGDWSSDVCSSVLGRLGGMVKGALAGRLREINVAPALGRALKAAMKEDRHVPLLDAGIRWANALLERNEVLIRSMVHERSGSILRWTGLDETIANRSEEHTSELQSLMRISYAVCCLKKKKQKIHETT